MINNKMYNYYMPTRVIVGKDCIIQHSETLKTLGRKALLVTGAQSSKRNGSEQDMKAALDAAAIPYLVYDQVMNNPTIACAYEGAKIARENGADFIIAIGGGSPMDAGKAIALLAAQDIAEENLFSGPFENKVLPMALVPTTAGTGSEVTQYSILTNDKAQTKTSIATDLLFPDVAFLDAKYMDDLPAEITVNTTIDALSHAIEGMLSVRASAISNALAAESIGMIMNCVPDVCKALREGSKLSLDSREQLLLASSLAGMVIAQTGTTVVHSMGYSLTYFKDIDHGRANGLLLGEYMRLVEKEQPLLIRKILGAMNLPHVDSFQDLMDCLLGRKEEFGSAEFRQYSKIAIQAKNVLNGVVAPDEEDILAMYEHAFAKKE